MLNAIVLCHYNFTGKNGKEIHTTKIRVSLGEYGIIELCTDKANDLPVLTALKVELEYNEKYNKYSVSKVSK